MDKRKFIISGGGTGGHIFPAISIANALKEKDPSCEILFVGAEGRMEMERVPAAGYPIVGLPIMGLPRKPSFKLLVFLRKWTQSKRKARRVIKKFSPDAVIGVGGYASGPILKTASKMGIPTVIQEQNSYAGITNRLLARKAVRICVAYDKMDRYFPADKIVYTGNPVRKDLTLPHDPIDAKNFFKLKADKPVILILGGSLGARTLNQSILAGLKKISNEDVEIIWQTGKIYYKSILEEIGNNKPVNLHIMEFVSRMDMAFAAADLVISRAGAGTISELCLVGKPSILVPSPNVAEDHQTKNAMALVEKGAALMIRDDEAVEKLIDATFALIADKAKMENLSREILNLAKPDASNQIANIILEIVKK
ncbi:MAG: undecaprenyldiphospho-muramoylpentapeptide beta-N-acetylglucosaminyltransferase [Bacteroidota bacterium]|nr:undecaprenyldiphospho-muramoylpentapeptide beta-N-acetylglucosaminyltransferase [Bacteroidota bacterium]